MEIAELTHEQQLGLVALIGAIMMTDGAVSEGEEREIGRLVNVFGEEGYRVLLEEAETRFADREALKAFLAEISDEKARELIYGAALSEAMAEPSVYHGTSDLMQWLSEVWNIRTESSAGEAAGDAGTA